ncbi:unnamed protein product, partial [Thlaspi arvense]
MRLRHMETRPPKIYGTKARMRVWQLKAQKDAGEFSLGQIWLVCPHIYLDDQPRVFNFWTRDAYKIHKCYNLHHCPGFIKTSQKVFIGGAISPMSIFPGAQTELTIQIWKDSKLRLWRLGVWFSNSTVVESVGYWLTKIFTQLIEYAEEVQWCGEITNGNISRQHTTTQMGSGYFPDSGFCTAAYMCDLEIAGIIGDFQPVYDLRLRATNPKYYNVKKVNDTCFFFGGPEYARGVSFRVELVILHFIFLFYFLAYII